MLFRKFKKSINTTIIFALFLIFGDIIYIIEALRIAPPIKGGEVGITFFPLIIALLMLLAAIIVLINGFKEKKSLLFNYKKISRPIAVIILTGIYIIIFKSIGYMFSSILYVFSLVLLLENKKKKESKIRNIVYSIIVVLVVYILYKKIF